MADKVISLEVDVDLKGINTIDKLEDELRKIDSELKKVKISSEEFIQGSARYRKVEQKLNDVKAAASRTSNSFDKMKTSSVTMKGGIDGASSSMNIFANGAKNSKELITELSSNLIGVTAIWGLVAVGIIAAGKALYEYVTRLTEAEKAEENLNKVREEGVSIVSSSIGRFRLLISVIQDETAAEEQRLLAKKALAKEYPDFNQLILDESLATDAASTSIDLYIAALKRQGKAKAAASLVAEKELEIVKEEIQLQKDKEQLIESIGRASSFDTGELEGRLKEVKLIDDTADRQKR